MSTERTRPSVTVTLDPELLNRLDKYVQHYADRWVGRGKVERNRSWVVEQLLTEALSRHAEAGHGPHAVHPESQEEAIDFLAADLGISVEATKELLLSEALIYRKNPERFLAWMKESIVLACPAETIELLASLGWQVFFNTKDPPPWREPNYIKNYMRDPLKQRAELTLRADPDFLKNEKP